MKTTRKITKRNILSNITLFSPKDSINYKSRYASCKWHGDYSCPFKYNQSFIDCVKSESNHFECDCESCHFQSRYLLHNSKFSYPAFNSAETQGESGQKLKVLLYFFKYIFVVHCVIRSFGKKLRRNGGKAHLYF